MAAVFDAIGTPVDNAAATTQTLTTLTVGVGSNRALVATCAWDRAVTAVTATWDTGGTNQAMTQIQTASTVNGQLVRLYGLVAPTSGTKTLTVSWTTSAEITFNAASWTGVDQTGGVTTFPHSTTATGNNTAPTVTVTSAAGNAVMAAMVNGTAAAISSVNNTQVMLVHGFGSLEAGSNRAAGAATVAMSGVLAGTDQWAIVGTDILASGGAAATIVIPRGVTIGSGTYV